jgi:hypothetical protein
MSPAPSLRKSVDASERRNKPRFPITFPVRYNVGDRPYTALTSDISSGGVFIHTQDSLSVGEKIQLRLEWPVLLEGRCPLQLAIKGEVIRTDLNGAAIRISTYEYRLRRRLELR